MSLAKLVVHLESNYSGLVEGLNQSVAHVNQLQSRISDAAPAVNTTRQSISGLTSATHDLVNEWQDLSTNVTMGMQAQKAVAASITDAAQSIGTAITGNAAELKTVAKHAGEARNALVTLKSAAQNMQKDIPEAADAAIRATGQLSSSAMDAGVKVYYTAKALDTAAASAQKLGTLKVPEFLLNFAQASYQVGNNLFVMQGNADATTMAMTALGPKVIYTAHTVSWLMRALAPVISLFRLMMGGAMAVGNSLFVLSGMATLAWEALVMLTYPFTLLKYMVVGVLAPFWLFYKAVVLTVRGVWTLVQPLIKLYLWVYKIKLQVYAAQLTLRILGTALGALSPRLRFLLFMLSGIGLSARVVSIGIHALTATVKGLSAVVRLSYIVFMGWLHPVRAAKAALLLLKDAGQLTIWMLRRLGTMARWTAGQLAQLGKASFSAVNHSLGNVLTRMVNLRTAIAAAAVAATIGFGGIGIKLAAAAETAHVPYANILRDATAAKRVLADIEDFAAMTPFQTDDLREAGRILLTAGVPARDLIDQMKMLGDVAAGTQTPIGEYANLYMKVRSTGRLALEELNSMARRGVPIYETLQQVLGVNRDEMLKMISAGQVGFKEFQAAVRLTTDEIATGSAAVGIFANATAKQSQTIEGLWSTLKDNFSFLARAFGEQIINAIDLKRLISDLIITLQAWKTKIVELRPAIAASWELLKASLHESIWLLKVVAKSFGFTGTTLDQLVDKFVEMSAIVQWAMENWPDIIEFIFERMKLAVVSFGEDIKYWFTRVIPAVIMNLPRILQISIDAFWRAWNGGKMGKKKIGGPVETIEQNLLNSVIEDISRAANLTGRATSELEKVLQTSANAMEAGLTNSLTDSLVGATEKANEIRERMKTAMAEERAAMAAVDLNKIGQQQSIVDEEGLRNEVEVKVTNALERNSAEAYEAITKAAEQDRRARDKAERAREEREKQMLVAMLEIAAAVGNLPPGIGMLESLSGA